MGQIEKTKIIEGVSTSVFFDMSFEDAIYRKFGIGAYMQYMQDRADDPLPLGKAFNDLSHAFLHPDRYEIVLCSRNSPLTARRSLLTFQKQDLSPPRMFFTNGKPVVPHLKAYGVDQFRTAHEHDVREANALGIFSGYYKLDHVELPGHLDNTRLNTKDQNIVSLSSLSQEQLTLKQAFCGSVIKHLVFDLDGVVFGSESEEYFQRNGLELYQEWEKSLREKPMSKGPAFNLLKKYADINNEYAGEHKPFIISVVTARGDHSAMRAIETLHHWGIDINGETHFRGGKSKEPIFEIMAKKAREDGIIIEFFDDQAKNIEEAKRAGIQLSGHILMKPNLDDSA